MAWQDALGPLGCSQVRAGCLFLLSCFLSALSCGVQAPAEFPIIGVPCCCFEPQCIQPERGSRPITPNQLAGSVPLPSCHHLQSMAGGSETVAGCVKGQGAAGTDRDPWGQGGEHQGRSWLVWLVGLVGVGIGGGAPLMACMSINCSSASCRVKKCNPKANASPMTQYTPGRILQALWQQDRRGPPAPHHLRDRPRPPQSQRCFSQRGQTGAPAGARRL